MKRWCDSSSSSLCTSSCQQRLENRKERPHSEWLAGQSLLDDGVLRLSTGCQPQNIQVNNFNHIVVSNKNGELQRVPGHQMACEAHFKTTLANHGLCVSVSHSTSLGSHVWIEFLTNAFGPDKVIRRQPAWEEKWCTRSSLLTVRVSTNGRVVDESFTYYEFTVTNVSADSIPTFYYMDSFVDCGFNHSLSPGKEVTLVAEREPHVSPHLPPTCTVSFLSTSEDEYEQVCMRLDILPTDSAKHPLKAARAASPDGEDVQRSLDIEGLNSHFYSIQRAISGSIVCSENKLLRLTLIRNQTTPVNFRATISSRWHEYWEKESKEAAELHGLSVVKNITYFVATIDTLIALFAAGLSYMLRKPRGPWKRWADNFNAHVAAHAPQPYPPQQEQGTYVSHSCQDGAYPELPGEMQASSEVHVEAHTF
ncbi:uncharacterized protein LOC112572806 isoform X3 [Pomacea canaliculata]|uniref:uncharacterized protein LOC112572806 isoform X3 n=1 Tax=Pomacea canaliculata TaxID=400727 RepID=UPI000D73A224|nr:uncharacterized protein LOC112572806 isoform X3 [Pomacea canaliculata]